MAKEQSNVFEELMMSFEERMTYSFEQFKAEIRNSLTDMFEKVKEKVENIEQRVVVCEQKLEEPCSCRAEILELRKELNRLQQHSRKDNSRIFGLKETKDENCKKAVCDMLEEKLGISLSVRDFSAAHRLPSENKDKPLPMIVRFKDRSDKEVVMKNRKKLKGTGISINDDITRDNMKLMNRAENSEKFESVWFSHGKVLGKLKGPRGKTKTLELFEKF